MSLDSDEHLVRYLLGDVSDEEAERLDERSITDEEFGVRLRVLEDDLVDRYARGAPFDASLERFDRLHRRSEHLREKLKFTMAWHAVSARMEGGRTSDRRVHAGYSRRPLGIASAAALLLLACSAYLGLRTFHLSGELGEMRATMASTPSQKATPHQNPDTARAARSFLLRAPRRGPANEPAIVSIPAGTDKVELRLEVDTDSYTTYWTALRDSSSRRVVWRSHDLPVQSLDTSPVVTVTLPVTVLATRGYAVELSGVTRRGAAELIADYRIRVMLE